MNAVLRAQLMGRSVASPYQVTLVLHRRRIGLPMARTLEVEDSGAAGGGADVPVLARL